MTFHNKKSKLLFFCIKKTFLFFLKYNLSYFFKVEKVNNLEIEVEYYILNR
jgi:hypothetical protein